MWYARFTANIFFLLKQLWPFQTSLFFQRNLTLDIITGILNDAKSDNTSSRPSQPDYLDPKHKHIAIPGKREDAGSNPNQDT
jgi:hypothetical protein